MSVMCGETATESFASHHFTVITNHTSKDEPAAISTTVVAVVACHNAGIISGNTSPIFQVRNPTISYSFV